MCLVFHSVPILETEAIVLNIEVTDLKIVRFNLTVHLAIHDIVFFRDEWITQSVLEEQGTWVYIEWFNFKIFAQIPHQNAVRRRRLRNSDANDVLIAARPYFLHVGLNLFLWNIDGQFTKYLSTEI